MAKQWRNDMRKRWQCIPLPVAVWLDTQMGFDSARHNQHGDDSPGCLPTRTRGASILFSSYGTYSKWKWATRGPCFPFHNSHCFLTYWYTASLKHIALVYIRPRYLQARQRQKQAEIRRRSNSSAQSIVSGFGFLQAVSEAVRDGDVSDEDEGEDKEEEEDTGNHTLEDSQEWN